MWSKSKAIAALLSCALIFGPRYAIAIGSAKTLAVVNSGGDTLVLVDVDHGNITRTVAVRTHPQDVVVSPDGKVAYVAEMGTMEEPGHTIAVVKLDSKEVERRLELGKFGLPHLLKLSRNGETLWAACAPQQAVVEVNTQTGKVERGWDTGQAGSYMFAVTRDEAKIYVANFDTGTLSVIRRTDNSTKMIAWSGQPIGIDISPDGKEVWVANFKTNEIAIVNTEDDKIAEVFSSGGDGPGRLKFTRDGKRVLVTFSHSNEVAAYDARRRKLLWKTATGHFPKGLFIDPDGGRAYVSMMEDGEVVAFDLDGKEKGRFASGKEPEGLAMFETSR